MSSIANLSKKLRIRVDFLIIIGLFLLWRISLIIFFLIAESFIPIYSPDRFLGGTITNYLLSPEIFSWANFDGEHYMSIAIFGYKNLEQAFFPVYPKLIYFLSKPFYQSFFNSLLFADLIGLLISHLSFLIALVVLWDLLRIDFSRKVAFLTLLSLLSFPTSFFFGSVYTESIFLLLTILSFYFARKKKWFLCGFFGLIASATRVFGILLLPALLLEIWQERTSFKKAFWILLIPLGLLSYMYYQFVTVGDFLAFYHLQQIIGEQHQAGITLLPQIYFRYLKILFSFPISNSLYQTILLEFLVGIIFFVLPIYGFFKGLRYSYVFFALASFIIPTLQGSFSSMPRYVIVLFPSFIVMALILNTLQTKIRVVVILVSFTLLALETALFLRGYWIA